MYNSMFTGWVYKNVPFPTKNAPKMVPCKLIKSDQKYGKKNLTETTLSFSFLYNHRKIKTSNFLLHLK